jgi:hypothetical protein
VTGTSAPVDQQHALHTRDPTGTARAGHHVHAGTKHYEMSRSCRDGAKPRGHIGTEDIVLDNGREPGAAVLAGNHCRKPVTQVEESPGVVGMLEIARMHPTSRRPPIELAASDMSTSLESTRQGLGDRGLPGSLRADHEPHSRGHHNSLLAARPVTERFVSAQNTAEVRQPPPVLRHLFHQRFERAVHNRHAVRVTASLERVARRPIPRHRGRTILFGLVDHREIELGRADPSQELEGLGHRKDLVVEVARRHKVAPRIGNTGEKVKSMKRDVLICLTAGT